MAPAKKQPAVVEVADNNIASSLEELKNQLDEYAKRFDRLEGLLEGYKKEVKTLKGEIKELKDTLEDRDKELYSYKEKQNDQEQYIRGWSIRILNLAVPEEEASEPEKVMQHVHNKLLLPILKGAKEKGLLHTIPAVDTILETAHILPAKEGAVPAIICRFYSRNIRAMIFRLRKECAPREQVEQPARSERFGRYQYPFYEDLTRPNFMKLRALAQHERVQSCWSVNGIIKFKLKDSETIRKVKSVFATVEDILK